MKPKKRSSTCASADIEQRRLTLIDNIQRIKISLESKLYASDPNQLSCRKKLLERYIQQLLTLLDQCDEMQFSQEIREESEELCITTEALLLDALSEFSNKSEQNYVASCNKYTKLPAQKLPKFSGKHSDYKSFIGLFTSLVHDNSALSNVEKFNHLLSCLTDEALGSVAAFQITDENYPKALDCLKSIYDNKCLIFFNTIANLFAIPTNAKSPAASVRSITDTVSAVYDSLLSLGDDKNISNCVLIHLAMDKIDEVTRLKWEEQLNYDTLPSWDECRTFLNKRFQALSAEENSPHKKAPQVKLNFVKKPSSKGSFVVSNSKSSNTCSNCSYCKASDHSLYACMSFKNMSVDKRFSFVKGASLCINCLRLGHTVSQCNSLKCRVCSRPHHTLLHRYSAQSQINSTESNLTALDANQPSSSSSCVHASTNEQVILATAVVLIKKQDGGYSLAKALLDSGSQVNCMTSELAQSLQLKQEHKSADIFGIGNSKSLVKFQVTTTVKSRVSEFQFTSQFLVMKSISSCTPDGTVHNLNSLIPKDIHLADPNFDKAQKIDILLGAETFFDLLAEGCIKFGKNLPTLKNTHFGWIVSGKFTPKSGHAINICHVALHNSNEEAVNDLLQQFWELEEVSVDKIPMTDEQMLCEKHFLDNISRTPSGRCVVSLPFKQDPTILGNSYEVA